MKKLKYGLTTGLCAAALGLSTASVAAPFLVTFTDTVAGGSDISGVVTGQQFTIELVLDNGGNSAANQSWSSRTTKCVTFRFNNAQNLFLAANYSSTFFTDGTSGNFTTNGAGQLQSQPGAIEWVDAVNPNTAPFATNIAGVSSVGSWFINGFNGVLYLNVGPSSDSSGMNNVGNNSDPANWTDPVPFTGDCGGAVIVTPHAVPTLSGWAAAALAAILALLGTVFVRRAGRRT